jgi:uncharacterized protein
VDQLASMLQVVILLASLAVWGMILERLFTGEPLVSRSVPATRPRPWLAIFVTLAWVGFSCFSQFMKLDDPPAAAKFNAMQALFLLAFNLLLQITTTCLLLVCLTRLGSQRLTRFGIDDRRPDEAIGAGLLGYLAAVIPVILVNVAMSQFRTEDNQHLFLQILGSQKSVLLVALMIGSAVIMAPIEEELMYRVILQGTLQRYFSPTASIVISASLFSAVHGFPDAVGLFPLALILGFLYWRTGSYLTVVTTHAAFNGVTVLLTLMSPEG